MLHRERVPRSFALLKACFSSAAPCPSAAMWSLQFSIFYNTNPKGQDGRGVCVWGGEEFGANLSDTGNTRNNRYTLAFHLFLYLFNFQHGRRQGNVALFSPPRAPFRLKSITVHTCRRSSQREHRIIYSSCLSHDPCLADPKEPMRIAIR